MDDGFETLEREPGQRPAIMQTAASLVAVALVLIGVTSLSWGRRLGGWISGASV